MATKNTCNCPTPPGGQVSCELHQLAICRVRNGVIETACIDPPMNIHTAAFRNWALAEITGVRRSPFMALAPQDHDLLDQESYQDPVTGEIVQFKLPTVPIKRP